LMAARATSSRLLISSGAADIGCILPNVKDEPRPGLARRVRQQDVPEN
jgi:hypothetical protein